MTLDWDPPEGWARISTLDVHSAGEPLRIVTDGIPEPGGAGILEKLARARAEWDGLRRALMLEPRGHADMYGCLLVAPELPDADFGVLFLHTGGFSTMCGHGIIGVVQAGLETGLIQVRDEREIRIDTPAGRVVARAERDAGGALRGVCFRNVPSFVGAAQATVEVEGLGPVRGDLAFGGAYYFCVDADDLGLELGSAQHEELVAHGRTIKRAVTEQIRIAHPSGEEDLGFLYGVIFTGAARGEAHSRNVCVFGTGQIDRSPTGTGLSARAAVHHARGELARGEWIRVESILGTSFEVRVLETLAHHGIPAVLPELRGAASITGRQEFLIDPDDPLREGFLLR